DNLSLHSFPTRRSSDLFGVDLREHLKKMATVTLKFGTWYSCNITVKLTVPYCRYQNLRLIPVWGLSELQQCFSTFIATMKLTCRSEEHTSELQSRENLV